jgi:phosphoribosyl 1,2-cyclic phosphodiesterase
VRRIDLLLTHLHLDHIEGLGFFGPLFRPDLEMHVWGPASTTLDLRARLSRLLSPPLFPVRLRDLPCHLELHDLSSIERFQVGSLDVRSALVCHPGPTVGFRISEGDASLAYLSDHEPAFGAVDFPNDLEWTSGAGRVGWGHSALSDALTFASAARARRVIPYHYDPAHTDVELDERFARARREVPLPLEIVPGLEGASFEL